MLWVLFLCEIRFLGLDENSCLYLWVLDKEKH